MLHIERVTYHDNQNVREVQVEPCSADAGQQHHSTRAFFLAFKFGERFRLGLFGHTAVKFEHLDTVETQDLRKVSSWHELRKRIEHSRQLSPRRLRETRNR